MRYGTAAAAILALAASGAAAQEGEGRPRLREVRGTVLKIDAAVGTIDIRQRGDGGQVDLTFNLSRAAKVTLDGKEAKLSDLAEGMNVLLRVSPATEDVQAVAAEGPTMAVFLRGVDAAARTLTLAIEKRERVLPLAPQARVTVDGRDAGLEELPEGGRVTLKLSVDGKSVLSVASGKARDGDREAGDRPAVRRDGDREGAARKEGDRERGDRPAERREGDRERPRRLLVNFGRLDANGDGKISQEEWAAAFAQYDADKDGILTDRELLGAGGGEDEGERRVERPDGARKPNAEDP
jgi:hypothetical protein